MDRGRRAGALDVQRQKAQRRRAEARRTIRARGHERTFHTAERASPCGDDGGERGAVRCEGLRGGGERRGRGATLGGCRGGRRGVGGGRAATSCSGMAFMEPCQRTHTVGAAGWRGAARDVSEEVGAGRAWAHHDVRHRQAQQRGRAEPRRARRVQGMNRPPLVALPDTTATAGDGGRASGTLRERSEVR